MSSSVPTDSQGSSTRPYLVRALHDWCTDNGFTPYIAVFVDGAVRVPMEYVKNGEIVLNVGFEATSGLRIGNDVIEFKARFGGVARDIVVPIDHVVAIYARENGQGMAFPKPEGGAVVEAVPAAAEMAPRDASAPEVPAASAPGLRLAASAESDDGAGDGDGASPPPTGSGGRPALKRIK